MLILAILAVVVPVITFLIGDRRGVQRERRRAQADLLRERDRAKAELVSKVADLYADLHHSHRNSGPHALSALGLDGLGSDDLIREAIRQMAMLTGSDPWAGRERDVDGVDLVAFFRYVRENGIKITSPDTMIPEIARKIGK